MRICYVQILMNLKGEFVRQSWSEVNLAKLAKIPSKMILEILNELPKYTIVIKMISTMALVRI